jgi:hypothetical protein
MKKEVDEALKLIELLLEQKRLTASEAFVLLKAIGCDESDSERGAPFMPNTPVCPSYPITYPASPRTNPYHPFPYIGDVPWLTPTICEVKTYGMF